MSWLPKSPKARRRLWVVAAVAPVLALAVALSPKAGAHSADVAADVARSMADLKDRLGKPLLCCWMGDASVGQARENAALSGMAERPIRAVIDWGAKL